MRISTLLIASLIGPTLLLSVEVSSVVAQATGAVGQTYSEKVQDWTQWRGPNRDGTIEDKNWPADLGESTLTKSWSIPMGPSYSGPIVVGDQVFVTETKDKRYEVVRSLDRKTGKEQWKAEWTGSLTVPFFAKANGDWIRSTPAYDEGKLYVGGIRDRLVCLDTESGEIVWELDFSKQYGVSAPTFGCVCSPLIDGDFLYMQAGGGFCKLDKKTGKVIWRVLVDGGGMNGSVFSSPYIATLAGQRQILVQMRDKLHGVDLESGDVLWSQAVKTFRGMNILTPTVYQDQVFLSTYGGTTQLLAVDRSDVKYQLKQVWNTPKQGYMSSPVIVDGHAYLNMKNKTISCFNLKTGRLCWSSPRLGQYASLITNGNRILVLDQTGRLLLLRANPDKFDVLDSRTVSNDSWAHLAVRGNEVFVRELDKITAYRWQEKGPSTKDQ